MINSVGNYYRPAATQTQPQTQSQPSFKGEEGKKEGMSTTTKTLLGLGALAAVGIGGLLLKKRIDLKNIPKKAEQLLQKPENFSQESFREVLKQWGLTDIKLLKNAKGKLRLLKKSELISGQWGGNYNELHKAMNMSDNGFALALLREDGKKTSFKYFDPKEISSPLIKRALQSDKPIVEFKLDGLIDSLEKANLN